MEQRIIPRILLLEYSIESLAEIAKSIQSYISCQVVQTLTIDSNIRSADIDLAILVFGKTAEKRESIRLAEKLNNDRTVPIIFLADAHTKEVVEEFHSKVHYHCQIVPKPINPFDLRMALKNALCIIECTSQTGLLTYDVFKLTGHILVRGTNVTYNINIENEIILLRADGEYTKLYTSKKGSYPIQVPVHMKEFLKKLSYHSNLIARVSRFEAVNIKKIKKIEDTARNLSNYRLLQLEGLDEPVKMSHRYKKEFMSLFNTL